MARIRLPSNWQPRPYQLPFWRYLENGGKRAIGVWHRRAGKDDVLLNWTAIAAHQRAGTYWHMLPEASQARKAIWEAVNPHTGIRRIDQAFPKELRASTRENEMFIKFRNGSTWQVVGSDNFNSLVGSPPIGVVFSEFALANPSAWAFMRPILAENGGWAAFISTPRGRNHFAKMFEGARADPAWFAERLSAFDTGAIKPEVLASELREYKRDYGDDDGANLFAQEYEVSFDAAIVGAYYARDLVRADADGRITDLPVDQAYPVHTAWDIGVSDSTVIWFFQVIAGRPHVVDYYANNGYGAEHYVDLVLAKPYRRGFAYLPHDIKVREFGSGRTRFETVTQMGLTPRLVADHTLNDGINAARQTLRTAVFDRSRCNDGIEALRNYRKKWDEVRRCYSDSPLHDWASHPADGLRYLAMSWRAAADEAAPDRIIVDSPRGPYAAEPPITYAGPAINTVTIDELWATQAPDDMRI
ncbi:hypothetical protein [uncultured Methylobacterium sp.]|uniref:hypothetical protein n=1 Tax=uncultured Methylobacterium sp. TaxID=157278 RepID=UPI0035C972B9